MLTDTERRASQTEWTAWQTLCGELSAVGAVTREDLQSPQGARDTQGQRLLAAIREWGEARVALANVTSPAEAPR